MHAILVSFGTTSEAYAYVSEIRRRADSMLWDVRVRRSENEAVVVVPDRVWRRDSFFAEVSDRYGGRVRDDDRLHERQPGSQGAKATKQV
jgi:hypothetical protein